MKKILFGLNKDGSFKVWTIEVYGDTFEITHGKEGGAMTSKITKVKGKNIGRANETSPEDQALLEAMSRYRKQLDKGYRESKEELSELPVLPMLASDYHKVGHRINYPCFVGAKLDGVRCLAIKKDDGVSLISRGGKPYKIPHIQDRLDIAMYVGEIWDGEIYHPQMELEEIVSATKKENLDTARLMFYVFDMVLDQPFRERQVALEINAKYHDHMDPSDPLVFLYWWECNSEEEMKQIHREYVEDGFEGVMLRNYDGMYEIGKRSADLQKYKTFMDEEFKILSISEDRNSNAVMELADNLTDGTFGCTLGNFEERKHQLNHPEQYVGKWLTVKFQKRYKDSLLPQFPVGVTIRECDEEGNPLV